MSSVMLALVLSSSFSPLGASPAAAADAAAGAVEVPLYGRSAAADPRWYVEAMVGEERLFLRLATDIDYVRMPAGVMEALGLKAKGDLKKATLSGLSFGGRSFDVEVREGAVSDADGEIGLFALQGVSWAILPSEGKVKLGGANEGSAWLSGLGGTTVSFTTDPRHTLKIGKDKTKEYSAGQIILPATWSGVNVPTRLRVEREWSVLSLEAEGEGWYSVEGLESPVFTLPAAPAWPSPADTTRLESRELDIGGVKATATLLRRADGNKRSRIAPAGVGAEVFGPMDLVVDPAQMKIGFRPATSRNLANYASVKEAELRAAMDPPAPKEGATAPTAEGLKDRRNGGIPGVANFLERQGRFDEATPLWAELAGAEPKDCSAQLSYGYNLLELGRSDEALVPLRRAAELYDAWAVLPLDERQEIEEDKAKAEKKKEEWTGATPQSHDCHVAWGLVAAAHLQKGAYGEIAAIYPLKMDLDEGLAVVAGNAALLQRDTVAAQAAFRQAIAVSEDKDTAPARYGMMISMASRDWATAKANFDLASVRALSNPNQPLFDLLAARYYFNALRSVEGAPAARAAVEQLVVANPNRADVLLIAATELKAQGDAAAAEAYLTRATARLEAYRGVSATSAGWWAIQSALLTAKGDAAGARTAANTAVKLAPDAPWAWLALADADAAAGDTAAATEHLKQAGKVGYADPVYALLLAP